MNLKRDSINDDMALRICFVQNVFPGPRATWFGFMGKEVVFRAIFKGEGFG